MSEYLKLKAKSEELMGQDEETRKAEIAEVIAELKEKIEEYKNIKYLLMVTGVKQPQERSRRD